jgi:putative spermidine/putrescine transport system permease protein
MPPLSCLLVIPAILIAIGIFLLYAQLGLNNTLAGIVLAHSVLAIPLVVITVASSLKSYDMNQEMVARSLGADALASIPHGDTAADQRFR